MYGAKVARLPIYLSIYFSLSLSLSLSRTDELRRQYTGALCGLGFDPSTGDSIYPDHDIELTFDTQITQDDIILVGTAVLSLTPS